MDAISDVIRIYIAGGRGISMGNARLIRNKNIVIGVIGSVLRAEVIEVAEVFYFILRVNRYSESCVDVFLFHVFCCV